MSTIEQTTTMFPDVTTAITDGAWRLDPARSSVAFTSPRPDDRRGRVRRPRGTLDLSVIPAVELTIEAASLSTKLAKRDEHLRSGDFFDAERHPQVRLISDSATLDGDTLHVRGELHAAGRQIPLELDATVREIDGELEIEAVTDADHPSWV